MKTIHDFALKSIDGAPKPLKDFRGRALLIVNVASACGYTPQYAGLEKLFQTYKARGLAVLGVPANDFGAQEPGTEAEIKTFCATNYDVHFDMASKVAVTGPKMDPLYDFLQAAETNPMFGGPVRWNFTKFLVSKDGDVVARFESKVDPMSAELVKAVEHALGT
jgi:glutathione peroxidase